MRMLRNRNFYFFAAGITFALAVGFLLDHDWATWIWPYYSYQMSRIFIASILLAVAAPVFLIGLKREWAAVKGGAINLGVMFSIMALFALTRGGSTSVLVFGGIAALFAVIQFGILLTAWPLDFQDQRQTPKPVLWSFGVFILVLVSVGIALLLKTKNVLPWSVSGDLSVLYGAVFLGAAFYFANAIATGVWATAQGPLLGFLAYDLVLIGPFLSMFQTIPDHRLLSLTVYTAVVVYSGVLAAYYLVRGPVEERAKLY